MSESKDTSEVASWAAVWEVYIKSLGQFVAEWNSLHDSLASLFAASIDARTYEIANAIWHSTPSDRAQRSMLRAAISNGDSVDDYPIKEFKFPHSFKAEVLWLLKEIDDIANPRNDAMHSSVILIQYITGGP